jgi:hypothetical protein
VILHLLRLGPIRPFTKPNPQICTCAKNAAGARYDDAFYARIDVEHGVCGFDFFAHRVGEGIVVCGTVQREDDDRGLCIVVSSLDLGEFEVVVGCGEGDVGLVAWGLVAGGRHGELLEY